MKDFYSNLIENLNRGNRVAVVSNLTPQGVSKTIHSEHEPIMYKLLEELEAMPNLETFGPVSFVEEGEDITVIERYVPKPRLIILGGGHIALALVKMAKIIDFHIVVFDDRPMFANNDRFPDADEVICDDFSRVFERISITSSDYVVIVTRGHKNDGECLEGVLKGKEPTYTGMIGSRRRIAIVLRQLEEQGYSKERLDNVYTPIGLKIGGVTPAEISISILAEIIEVKRKGVGKEKGLTCDLEIVEWLAEHGDEIHALLTILDTRGSVPRESGAKMAMTYDGKISGTIGGGCAESGVMQEARTAIREGGWKIVPVDMTDTAEEDGMVCGGKMRVLVETVNIEGIAKK